MPGRAQLIVEHEGRIRRDVGQHHISCPLPLLYFTVPIAYRGVDARHVFSDMSHGRRTNKKSPLAHDANGLLIKVCLCRPIAMEVRRQDERRWRGINGLHGSQA